ncbi:MAG: hypothetical protein HKN32_08640, partial [Flavobacteriales bacterium]|nr:hypothetical protein [Flavobacteriales bacterium]
MKKLISLLAVLFVAQLSLAQSDTPAGATTLPVSYWSLGTPSSGTLTGASNSGLAGYCQGIPTNDVFYRFTATTQGIKATCSTTDFDMVVEIRDGVDPNVVVDCVDAVFGAGGETIWISDLTAGDDYYICVYSNGGAGAGNFDVQLEYLPAVELRPGYYPFPVSDAGLPGYAVAELTKRVTNADGAFFAFNMAGLIEATRWKFVDPSDNSEYFADVAGDNINLGLNDVPGPLCFGKTYDVQCQIMLEGQWCGYSVVRQLQTEAQPNTLLSATYVNGWFDLSASIKANFVGSDQQLYWRLTTDNNNTVIDFNYPNDPDSWLNFPDVSCMRFNKIYGLEIAVEYCGVVGPYSDPVNVFTINVPYSKVRDEYCGT